MILSEPGRTDYDWNFSILGFDVRVHPLFFVIPILLGFNYIDPNVNTGVGLLVIIAIFFVSILVHELGHAVAFRYYGLPARIVLYWMGGLAIPDSGGAWASQHRGSLTANQQIVVSLAGPIFGLLIAVVLAVIVFLSGGSFTLETGNGFPFLRLDLKESIFEGSHLMMMVFTIGIALNIFLNLLNLLPVFPLDGGQVARQIMVQMDRFNGLKNSIFLSIAVSGMLAAFFFLKLQQPFAGIFFAYMAWTSYQMLQQFQGPRW